METLPKFGKPRPDDLRSLHKFRKWSSAHGGSP